MSAIDLDDRMSGRDGFELTDMDVSVVIRDGSSVHSFEGRAISVEMEPARRELQLLDRSVVSITLGHDLTVRFVGEVLEREASDQ